MVSVGDTLQERYRILRLVGEGAMGAVYEAEHLLIHRRVAIKVLHAATARNAEASARFEREAQVSGQILSDHITEVLDLGRLGNGDLFIVMEFLAGETLAERIRRRGRLSPSEAIGLLRQVLAALEAAHGAGVVHRDVKPENVFILQQKAGQRDFVKLMDFGVSKFRETDDKASLSLTRAGFLMGTPCYMSPEQARGIAEASKLSDLYAVGIILYESLTGELPFESANLNDLLFQIVLGKAVAPGERLPELDAALESIVCKAMARAPEERFQSAAEFSAALERWSSERLGVERPRVVAEHLGEGAMSSTSPLEHSITVSGRQHARRGSWLLALGALVLGLGIWLYRAAGAVPQARVAPAGEPAPVALPAAAPPKAAEPLPSAVPSTVTRASVAASAEPGPVASAAAKASSERFAVESRRVQRAGTRKSPAAKPVSAPPDQPAPSPPAGAGEPSLQPRPDWGY